MARHFTVTLTLGTNSGPYSIYYDQISVSNLALLSGTTTPASGITLSEVQTGVTVEIPDGSTLLYLENNNETFTLDCPTNYVTSGPIATPTATPSPTATPVTPTATPVTPTATPVTPTATPVTPTATPGPTATPVTPTATPVTPTATPVTPTATPNTPLPVYYRFENCDTSELVFQNNGITSEPAANARYTDGVTNFIYTSVSTTQPGTIVTNLSGPIGTGCFNPTATPLPEYYFWIERCDADIDRVMRTTTNSGLFAGSSSNDSATVSIFGTCYWIKSTATSGDFLTGGDESSYDAGNISSSGVGCTQCQGGGATPTPTPIPGPTPTPFVTTYYEYYITQFRSDDQDFCNTNYITSTLVKSESPTINGMLNTMLFDSNEDPYIPSVSGGWAYITTTSGNSSNDPSNDPRKIIQVSGAAMVDSIATLSCSGQGGGEL